MTDRSNHLFAMSRRRFSRIGSAALFSLPFISACTKRDQTPPLPGEARGFSTKLVEGVEEHIPPMGLTDGSLDFSLYNAFDPIDGDDLGGGRWRYKIPGFGNIKKVAVMMTNEENLYVHYYANIGKPVCDPRNFEIKLWLQERMGSNYKPIDMTKPPEVVISSPGMLQIEINEKLARKRTKHPYRPWKYEHEGNGYSNNHFRIGALDITSSNCPEGAGSARWVTRDLDHYQIWIYGPDIPH
jgi:hypothetical protein